MLNYVCLFVGPVSTVVHVEMESTHFTARVHRASQVVVVKVKYENVCHFLVNMVAPATTGLEVMYVPVHMVTLAKTVKRI